MSEPEGFLSRWARLKRAAVETPDAAAPDAATDESGAAAPAADATPVPESEPAFDLSSLPPIESITATTDIRAFLAPGVPADLTRAALRRAWVADPRIRDFVGIAENQWDFNDPNGIPGFGPIDPLDVRRLLAQAIGEVVDKPEEPALEPSEENSPAVAANGDSVATSTPEMGATGGELPSIETSFQTAARASDVQRSELSIAVQTEEPKDVDGSPSDAPVRRAHGGALPK